MAMGPKDTDDAVSQFGASSTGSKSPLQRPTSRIEKQAVETSVTRSRDAELARSDIALDFPEGGLQGWLTVLGGFLITFCSFGVVQSFGVYQDYYTRKSLNEHTPSEVSWIGSVQVFFLFAMGLPAGRLFDAGYFHHCIISGSVIYIFSIFMLSLAKPHHYYQNFLAQGVGMGIGMGLMFLPSLTVTSHFFRRKRSLAMGIVVAGSSFGGCLYPVLLNNVFQRAPGFPWAVRAVALLDMGLLIIANFIIRTRLPSPKMRAKENSEILKEVTRDISYLLYVLGTFLVFWGIFVPFFYLQLYAALHDVDPLFTKYSITVMNAASVFGRTLPNILADFYGPLNVMIMSSLLSAGLIFAIFGATSVGGVAAFAICYGFCSGGAVSMATPAASRFARRSDLSDLGIRIGLLSFALAFAVLTGSPIAGALLAAPHYRWHQTIIFAAVVVLGGAVCHCLVWRLEVKRKSTKFV